MFLKNSRVWMSYLMGMKNDLAEQGLTVYDGKTMTDFASNYQSAINIYANIDGTMKMIADVSKIGSAMSQYSYGVLFGTGTVPPTSGDYKMSGTAIAGLSSSNVTMTSKNVYDDNGVELTYEYTINNTTGADITIGEVGLAAPFYTKEGQYYAERYYTLLLERTVLDSPVTIPKGGVGQVTYTIRMNYPA